MHVLLWDANFICKHVFGGKSHISIFSFKIHDEVVYIYVYSNGCHAVIILNDHFYRHLHDRNVSLFCQSYGLLLVGAKSNIQIYVCH